jgi:hypothetical protein
MDVSSVRLRALSGEPLNDEAVRGMVVAAAQGLAERSGVVIRALTTEPDALLLTIEIDKLAAMGFLAELRRTTDAWHKRRHGSSLWGEREEWR